MSKLWRGEVFGKASGSCPLGQRIEVTSFRDFYLNSSNRRIDINFNEFSRDELILAYMVKLKGRCFC